MTRKSGRDEVHTRQRVEVADVVDERYLIIEPDAQYLLGRGLDLAEEFALEAGLLKSELDATDAREEPGDSYRRLAASQILTGRVVGSHGQRASSPRLRWSRHRGTRNKSSRCAGRISLGLRSGTLEAAAAD